MEVIKHTKDNIRCDFILTDGRKCLNAAVDGVTRCPLHGANKQLEAKENASLRLYRLAKHQGRIGELSDHSKLKTLNEEVALLRMLLEESWNRCEDTHQLLLASQPLTDLIMKVERVVTSCHKLENSLGGLLDKTRIKQIANEMLNSVAQRTKEVLSKNDHERILELIATDLLRSINDV
jgi:hypothetical protein